MLTFLKKHRWRIVALAGFMLCVAALLAYAYIKNQASSAADELTTSTYKLREPDELFLLNADKLNDVDRMMVTSNDVFAKRNVLVLMKGSNEVDLYRDVTYQAFDQYSTVILNDYLKANTDFQFSMGNSLSGVGARFGVPHDPMAVMAKQQARSGAKVVGRVILMLVIVCALMYVMIRVQSGAITNHIDMFHPKDITDDLDDLVGLSDIKQELLQLEEMVNSRSLYRQYGVDKVFNVMMTGPAGTGKTKIARCLSKRLNVPIFYASAASLESGYVGGGPRTLKRLQKQASKYKRAIIFLDEAESLMVTRDRNTQNKYENDSNTTLLSLLDGVNTKKDSELIWVVASNFDEHKMTMDEAMLRRFHLKINFRLPNHEERREILRRLLSKRDKQILDTDIDLDHIAGITSNMSPAALETLVARVSFMAVKDKIKINQDLLLQAFERVAVGLTDRATTDKLSHKRHIVAVHEAGHFLMQVHHTMMRVKGDVSQLHDKMNVIKISTESVSKIGALGFVLSKTEDVPLQTRTDYDHHICELYGGMANEELFFNEAGVTAGAHNDITKVTEYLDVMFNEVGYFNPVKINYTQLSRKGHDTQGAQIKNIEQHASKLYEQTKSVLERYRPASEVVVKLLMDHYVMTLDDVIPHLEQFYENRPDLLALYAPRIEKVTA